MGKEKVASRRNNDGSHMMGWEERQLATARRETGGGTRHE
jgi:hypothetical protein